MFEDKLTRFVNMDYLVGDYNILFMESWNFLKSSDRFCCGCKFWVAVLFYVSFFASSFYILFSSTSLYCATLSVVRYIPEL